MFKCLIIGASDRIRPLWKHYLECAVGIIFVIDSNDTDRIDQAEEELRWFLRESRVPFLIIANKQDLPKAMSIAEIASRLKLNEVTHLPWNIIATCGETGDGVEKLLDWMKDLSNGKDMRGFT